MAIQDKIKWDTKYLKTPKLLQKRDPSSKLVNFLEDVSGTHALDVACGNGRNSLYLAKMGFFIDALDISSIALESLESHNIANIHTQLVDLEEYMPIMFNYDLIIMTNYLNRELIPSLGLALKQNGILIIETYMHHKDNEKPNSNPDFLLQEGELKTFFDEEYEVLEYDEFDNEPQELYRMRKQSIVIRKK